MRVGLLSMQRVPNYGSFWQAYCLKKMIQDCGNCSVEFIDIKPGEVETRCDYKRSFSFSKIKRIPYYLFQRNKRAIFNSWQQKVLGCTESRNYGSDYDSIVIGSDEVFNFVQDSPWGFTTQLYGDIDNPNVNSYAASFGYTTYENICEKKRGEQIANGLCNMKHISVRDQNSAEIIKKLVNKEPDVLLDPVVVGDLPEELPDIKEQKYILVYSYDFRLSETSLIKEVRAFAKKKQLKIISVGFYQDWVDKNILPTPLELLRFFKNAEYVVTDTFHGTIFSARMHKKFVSIIRKTNEQKLGDLLNRIGMDSRRYSIGDSIPEKIEPEIDGVQFEQLRAEERMKSNSFLKACLGREQ